MLHLSLSYWVVSLYLSRNTKRLSLRHIEQIDLTFLFSLLMILNFIMFLSYFYDVTFNALLELYDRALYDG